MRCAGCQHTLEVGDNYIEATASEITGIENTSTNALIAEILGSGNGDKLVYCEDCTRDTEEGFKLSTYYGDES